VVVVRVVTVVVVCTIHKPSGVHRFAVTPVMTMTKSSKNNATSG
jgi:hypothetical protein